MPEKTQQKAQQQQQKTKELKVFSTQVVTLDTIKNDKRKLTLLLIIKNFGSISEKALAYLIELLHNEKKIDLGYNIVKLGNKVIVRELTEDIRALLYVGVAEVNPQTKKLQVTSRGMEFLDSLQLQDPKIDEVLKAVEEVKIKVIPIDEEVATAVQLRRQGGRG
ncbi:MAG: hypothetical protein JHC33_14380 [Ignisphaera sp.]|nr:hypothetical protein [Ignisphaera sp.]